MITFKEFLAEKANESISKEGSTILTIAKKGFSAAKSFTAEKIYDFEETVINNKPGIIIYSYASFNGASSGISSAVSNKGYTYHLDISYKQKDDGSRFKNETSGVYKEIRAKYAFDRPTVIRYMAIFVEYKNSITADQFFTILGKLKKYAKLQDNKILIDSDEMSKSEISELESIASKYKNVKVNFGGYYADVDNKHFVSTGEITF